MFRPLILSLALCFGFGMIAGCEKSNSTREVPTIIISPAEQIKNALQITISNGVVGSEFITIEENIGKLDGGKSAELKADLEELKGLQGAKAVAKAKEMTGKL